MYGGLFGDLPAAKKASEEAKEKDAAAAATAMSKTAHANDDDKAEAIATTTSRSAAAVVEEPKAFKLSSVLQSLGVAGTSMAFVPSHLKRKRVPAPTTSTSTSSTANNVKKTTVSSNSPATATAAVTDLASWKEETQTVVKSNKNSHDQVHPTTESSSTSLLLGSSSTSDPATTTTTTIAVESEETQRLHDSVTDPYDPLVPNDLLQHWERRAAMQERKELEREHEAAMKSQAKIREQLEVERRHLEQSGDANKLLEHRNRMINSVGGGVIAGVGGRGRGRGRGVSNLPKWLVDQQRKEAEMRNATNNDAPQNNHDQ